MEFINKMRSGILGGIQPSCQLVVTEIALESPSYLTFVSIQPFPLFFSLIRLLPGTTLVAPLVIGVTAVVSLFSCCCSIEPSIFTLKHSW